MTSHEQSFSFSKVKEALEGHDPAPQPAATTPPHPAEKKEEGWGERIKDVLDGGASKRHEEEERLRLEKERLAAEAAKKKAEEDAGFLGKVKHVLGGSSHEEEQAHQKAEAVDTAQRKAVSEEMKKVDLIARLKDLFDGDEDKAKAALVAEELRDGKDGKGKDEHWFSKIKDKFNGDEAEANKAAEKVKHAKKKQEEEGWSERFTNKVYTTLGGKPKEPEPERSWLGNKLHELGGGGAKAEANESHLDKAIDLVQEHILHQGDQHNESAIEQLKDKQIAAGVRKAFGSVTGQDDKKKHH